MGRFAASVLAFAALGCGSKTGLGVPEPPAETEDAGAGDAGPRMDAPPPVDSGPVVPVADECVELPYDEPPEHVDVSFVGRIHSADVVFLVDVTGSMSDEIAQIRATLRDTIVPEMARTIPEVRFSVASFADFPVSPYGGGTDRPYRMLQQSTSDLDDVQRAVGRLDDANGGDGPESQVEALYQTATGEGRGSYIPPASCRDGTVGYPCFPPEGSRIILLFTDAEFHNGPGGTHPYAEGRIRPSPATYDDTVSALREIGGKVLGLFSGGGAFSAREDLELIARDTGAVSPDGEPIVFDIGTRGERLDTGVIDTVTTLVEEVPIDVDVLVEDWPGDELDGTEFVDHVEALRAEPSDGATKKLDRFDEVRPGTRIVFRIHLQNELVPPSDEDQSYFLTIVLRGDRATRLREHTVEIVVPGLSGDGCD